MIIFYVSPQTEEIEALSRLPLLLSDTTAAGAIEEFDDNFNDIQW